LKTLHRFRFVLLAVTGVLLIAATVYSLRPGDDTDAVAGRLGPTPGPSSEGHIRAQKAYLDGLAAARPAERAAALVSLDSYVPASRAQAIARSMDATAVFVRFAEADPESVLVRTSIADSLKTRTTDLRREIEAEIDALGAEAQDATGDRKRDLEDLIAQRRRELGGIEPDCACVFAFAVEGASIEALSALAKRPEVRLVDVPEPLVGDLDGWEVQPIVPKAAEPA
jgi:hypothetical protein